MWGHGTVYTAAHEQSVALCDGNVSRPVEIGWVTCATHEPFVPAGKHTPTHLTGSSLHDSDDMYMTCATHVFNTTAAVAQ